jgi:anti-sigma regulatory factor (Ser/Thr protein kinase)
MGTMRFDASAESARAARGFVRQALGSAGLAELDEIAILLTSELVTNVVRHSHSGGKVDVEVRDRVVRVSVSDDSPIMPAVHEPETSADGGRGLWLVAQLSDDWGATRVVDDGKVVWFETSSERAPA